MMKKKAEAEAEVLNLRRMWIEAERIHPILAAYRHGGAVDKVDLGTLDTDAVEGEMHAVLVRLLPKLADLLEEEPSLTPFVVSLVTLGLEPLALVKAFNKARELRALAKSGKDTSALVDELNKIGKPRKPNLGNEALEDIAAAVLKIDELALGYGSRAEVRAAVLRRFAAIRRDLPQRWDMVRAALRETDSHVNRALRRLVDRHMTILRDPEAWADVIADAWEIAAGMPKPSLRKGLLQLAINRGIKKMVKVRKVLEGGTFFEEVVVPGAGIVDPKLAVGVNNALHGELTHLIQDLVVDSKLGPGASAAFCAALKHAEGTIGAS